MTLAFPQTKTNAEQKKVTFHQCYKSADSICLSSLHLFAYNLAFHEVPILTHKQSTNEVVKLPWAMGSCPIEQWF